MSQRSTLRRLVARIRGGGTPPGRSAVPEPRPEPPPLPPPPPPVDPEEAARAQQAAEEAAAQARAAREALEAAREALARVKTFRAGGADPDAVVADLRHSVEHVSTRSAALVLVPSVAAALRQARRYATARSVVAVGMELTTGEELRVRLRTELLLSLLDEGSRADPEEVLRCAGDLMAVADRRVEEGRPERAAVPLRACLDLLLHRTLHYEDDLSPLAADAAAFLRPLHASRTYSLLAGEPRADGSAHDEPGVNGSGSGAPGRDAAAPRRLLFVANGNWHFLEPILARYRARADVEVRTLDLSDRARSEPLGTLAAMTLERLSRLAPEPPAPEPPTPEPPAPEPPGEPAAGGPAAAAGAAAPEPVPEPQPEPQPEPARISPEAAELLEWADTVFVEWCDNAALWASLTVPSDTRLIVRLHAVEAFSVHPQLVDWSRVSDLVTVSSPLMRLVGEVAPGTAAVRRHVLPNAVELADLPTGKSPEAARTVAMIGWSSASKDPLFALDVLAGLRRHDPAWRLLLIGADFPDSLRARSRAYKEAFEERLRSDPDLTGAVERLGHVGSVARPEVGFVLSSSLRESFHVGLMQAAASAAVPVVRDWPTLRRLGGAAAVVPAEWVVADVEGAIRRVLDHADPAVRERAGEQARRAVVARYDWSSCADGYDALLLT